MLHSHPIMAFSATTEPARALAFYRDVLGLRLVADEPWAIVFDAAGTMLRIQKAPHHTPAPHTLLGWQVSDIAAVMRGLADRGVTFVRYDFLPADSEGIWSTPDGTKVAWFKDPDGNTLSLTEFSPRT
jgi:catechol 2,3-dioxygenase-like lactoylglutathione lyase family enzyme